MVDPHGPQKTKSLDFSRLFAAVGDSDGPVWAGPWRSRRQQYRAPRFTGGCAFPADEQTDQIPNDAPVRDRPQISNFVMHADANVLSCSAEESSAAAQPDPHFTRAVGGLPRLTVRSGTISVAIPKPQVANPTITQPRATEYRIYWRADQPRLFEVDARARIPLRGRPAQRGRGKHR